MQVVQAYRYALDPTPAQARALAVHCGAARFVFNWALALIKANLGQRGSPRLPCAGRRAAGRWRSACTSNAPPARRAARTPRRPDAVVGVDLGVRTLAAFSDDRPPAANPKHLAGASKRLRRAARAVSRKAGPDRQTGQQPSRRWQRANAARNRAHHRVAALRRDALHQLTTGLAREYGAIVVEDLNVAGMIRNRRLAKAISDAGFGEIRRQLTYKTVWNGGRLIVADRWYPSSKTCSACGTVKAKLPLSARTFTCPACGLAIDRDRNAARNLASLVQHVAGSGPETVNGHGADQKTPPRGAGGCETSTPHRATGQDGDLHPAMGASLRTAEIQ
ncbi:RNA-guided endonuclease TnpB family protein [Nonomuraea sp. NPDC050404]|uniref:RNA-guided endonuclease TnpB family protein n=1 Tax=Nonomuraea sp. NPDC050404 TaxID=3155783 RepID=UPI00341099AE